MARALAQSELENFSSLQWNDIAPHLTPELRSALEESSLPRTVNRSHGNNVCCWPIALATICWDWWWPRTNFARNWQGNLVTYVFNRNINFTNICFVGASFAPSAADHVNTTRIFSSLIRSHRKRVEAWRLGATEVCIQGGLPHDLPPFYYRDILRAVKQAVPSMHCHAFSPMEIVYGVELTGMPVRDYLQMLRDNGLDTLPGTAAEILDDEVRAVLSRNKLSTSQWREVITHGASAAGFVRHRH